jgi:hypothetical protein
MTVKSSLGASRGAAFGSVILHTPDGARGGRQPQQPQRQRQRQPGTPAAAREPQKQQEEAEPPAVPGAAPGAVQPPPPRAEPAASPQRPALGGGAHTLPPARRSAPLAALAGSRALADELAGARGAASDGEGADAGGSESGGGAAGGARRALSARRRSLTVRRSNPGADDGRCAATRLAQSTGALPSTSLPAAVSGGTQPQPPHPLAHAASAPLAGGGPFACSWPPPPQPHACGPSPLQPGFEPGLAPSGSGGSGAAALARRSRGTRRPTRPAGGLQRELACSRSGSGALAALGLGFGMGSRAQSMEELGLIDGSGSGSGSSGARGLFGDGAWGEGGGGSAAATAAGCGAEPHSVEWFEQEMAQVGPRGGSGASSAGPRRAAESVARSSRPCSHPETALTPVRPLPPFPRTPKAVEDEDFCLPRAQALWADMRARGARPSRQLLRSFLQCCFYGGADPGEAEEAARDMCAAGGFEADGATARLLTAIDLAWEQLHAPA